ncbi:MAG TPA: TA system VapC family ribonuclease toxin [Terracidiphilus sp.]|nr:TA system VapC family ribonuclease toxin [Terracidiphilus sp.]
MPDVNVWVAFTSDQHVHHSAAKGWFQSLGAEQIAFCRIAELGFLRLLTNSRVMGEDVLDPIHAWRVYDDLRSDPQIIFLPEQAGFSEYWRQVGDQIAGGPNAWTDAYLAAFAAHAGATVVTFDRRFKAIGNCDVLPLPD